MGSNYTQYWTPSIGGIFMKYSYEYKKKCVELYRQGKWPETPEGVNEKRFHDTIRIWVRTEDACGPEAFRHKNQNKVWATEEKYELIAKILAGASCKETAISIFFFLTATQGACHEEENRTSKTDPFRARRNDSAQSRE